MRATTTLFHIMSEEATGGVLYKKVFLAISQNSQENTCARFSGVKRDTSLKWFLKNDFYCFLKVATDL